MTSEEWYLIFMLLGSWILSISAVAGIIVEHYGRKAQYKQMEDTITAFTLAIKKAPKSKVNPALKAEAERQKTLQAEARLEKEKVKQGTAWINLGGKLLGKNK